MKFLIKKINIILFSLTIFLNQSESLARDNKVLYTRENISNYFLGIISAKRDFNREALKYLKKVESLKNVHSEFNNEFIKTLILLEKFEEAFEFSKNIWDENQLFFEADLLLGLEAFIREDYKSAEKYFWRLNKLSRSNLFFDNFIGNILISWSKASQGEKENSFKILEKIPKPYHNLRKTQYSFLKCYFDDKDTQKVFEEIIQFKGYNFERYNFFLANYFLFKAKN